MQHKIQFATAAAVALTALHTAPAHATDWLQFGYDTAHSGYNRAETGYSTPSGNRALYHYPLSSAAGSADSAPIYLGDVTTSSGTKNLLFVTTKNGTLVALDADSPTLSVIWSKKPAGAGSVNTGSAAIDPGLQYVYAYGVDGNVHKYQVGDGQEIGVDVADPNWPQVSTIKPEVEKGAAGLSIATAQDATTYLYSVTDGYIGDQHDYQGHITAINLATGAQKVFNSECSNKTIHFCNSANTMTCVVASGGCASTQNGIWGRPGAIYDSGTNRLFITTGNGPFNVNPGNGIYNWGDSILALNPDGSGGASAGMPVDSYTPGSFQGLQNTDADLGSVSIAILKSGSLGLQVGKDACVRLVRLDNMSNQLVPGPGHTGGELQALQFFTANANNCATGTDAAKNPGGDGGDEIKPQPAVWVNPADQSTWAFVANPNGMAAYQLTIPNSGDPFLTQKWTSDGVVTFGGTSPIVANATVYYMAGNNKLLALDAVTGTSIVSGTSSWGAASFSGSHWQSPVIVNGRIYLVDSHSPAQVWVYQLDGAFKSGFE